LSAGSRRRRIPPPASLPVSGCVATPLLISGSLHQGTRLSRAATIGSTKIATPGLQGLHHPSSSKELLQTYNAPRRPLGVARARPTCRSIARHRTLQFRPQTSSELLPTYLPTSLPSSQGGSRNPLPHRADHAPFYSITSMSLTTVSPTSRITPSNMKTGSIPRANTCFNR